MRRSNSNDGGGEKTAAQQNAPRLADIYMESMVISGTKSDRPTRSRGANGLDRPSENLAERGDYPGHVAQTSLCTKASLHPVASTAIAAGAGLAVAALLRPVNSDGARSRKTYLRRRGEGNGTFRK